MQQAKTCAWELAPSSNRHAGRVLHPQPFILSELPLRVLLVRHPGTAPILEHRLSIAKHVVEDGQGRRNSSLRAQDMHAERSFGKTRRPPCR